MLRNDSAIMRLLKRPRQHAAKFIRRRQIEDAVPLSDPARPDGHAPGAALRHLLHGGHPPRSRRATRRRSGLRPDRHTTLSGNRPTVGCPHRPELGRWPGLRQSLPTSKNFFLHLRSDWLTLPEPIPPPHKYERRVFAIGVAYEFIAVRISANHLDLSRQCSLAGATHHVTADRRIIPLLSKAPPSESAPQSEYPQKIDLIGDRSRRETMSRLVADEPMVLSVRKKPQELFNRWGREDCGRRLRGIAGKCWNQRLRS
jgi:hypothetical protein